MLHEVADGDTVHVTTRSRLIQHKLQPCLSEHHMYGFLPFL